MDADAKRLIETSRKALEESIAKVKPGNSFKAITQVISYFSLLWMNNIERDIAKKSGFNVVHNLVGHGIGRDFHTYPIVYHTSK